MFSSEPFGKELGLVRTALKKMASSWEVYSAFAESQIYDGISVFVQTLCKLPDQKVLLDVLSQCMATVNKYRTIV